jgi:hypothetical protein
MSSPPDPQLLADACDDLLAAVAAALSSFGLGAPSRQFVSHGPPAWDLCETDQLTVHLASTIVRQDAGRIVRGQAQLVAALHAQLVRCHPALTDAGPPTVAAMDTAAHGLLVDLAAVEGGVIADPPFADCWSVQWGTAVPLGPQGAVAGWDWTVTLTLG